MLESGSFSNGIINIDKTFVNPKKGKEALLLSEKNLSLTDVK